MGALITEKKALMRQAQRNPALAEALQVQIAEIDSKLDAKVNQSDQNHLRVFYRMAKELLPREVFNKLEDISSTRVHNHTQKSKYQG